MLVREGDMDVTAAYIEAIGLRKEFRVALHREGTFGAIKGLISRKYNTVNAVDGVSFAIRQGELVGYLGPNGAGKSTTIKMLTGIIVPSGGALRVGGLNPSRDRCRHVARLGVVFGQRSNLWWDLPVIESLQLLRHIYRVPEGQYKAALAEFTDILELGELLAKPVEACPGPADAGRTWLRHCCTALPYSSWMNPQ